MVRILIALAGLIIIAAASWPWLTQNPEGLGLRALAERSGQTYIQGYPLVLTDVTRQALLAQTESPALNTLYHRRTPPRFEDRTIVRPNLDTLYSVAFLDLSEGPVVLRTPDFSDRDWMFQVMDAWTVVAGAPSQRLNGPGPHAVMIASPHWADAAPEGMAVITVDSHTAWMIGRIAITPGEDLSEIHALQNEVSLSGAMSYDRPQSVNDRPPEYVNALSSHAFFSRMAHSLSQSDPERLALLTFLGLENTESQDRNALGPLARKMVELGVGVARQRLEEGLQTRPYGPTNWRTLRDGMGEYGEDYALRAGVALVGLGANRAEDAIYPNTDIDSTGALLHGDHIYQIRFEAGQTPPVDAFWSVTVYNSQGYLIDTETRRHTINSRTTLLQDADGGLTLRFSADPPPTARENWLPIPAGEPFALTARLYTPHPDALSGAWEMPAVTRISD